MSVNVLLPQKYSLILLRKLADDDAFRSHYESSPSRALIDIGVPAEILARVAPENLRPIQLASKGVFAEALSMLMENMVCVSLCLIQPQIHVFAPVKGKGIATRVPFTAPDTSLAALAETGRLPQNASALEFELR